MTSKEFVIWLKGFTEACNDFTATPKQWDRIKEVLDEIEDEDQGLDVEIDDWYHKPNTNLFPPNGIAPTWVYPNYTNGTIYTQGGTITFSSGSSNTSITNLPSGANITYTNKQQLND